MKNIIQFLFLLSVNCYGQCYTSNSAFDATTLYKSHSSAVDFMTKDEVPKLIKAFNVVVDFKYGIEKDGPNAEFSPTSCPLTSCYGNITLGSNLITLCMDKTNGDQRIIAILAHEFAHAAQSKNNFPDLAGKYPELHADYLAGYYIGQRGLIEKSLLASFADQFYSIGDNNFFAPSHHGTASERRCAFLEGYKMAIDYKFNFIQAYNAGIDYLVGMMPCNANYIIKKYSKTEINTAIPLNPRVGNYFIKTTKETIYVKNIYGQIIATITPNQPLTLNGLEVGNYSVYLCKKSIIGRIKRLNALNIQIIQNKTSGFIVNKTGFARLKQYTIDFPK